MNKELSDKLRADFPELCADYGGDMRVTCMAWGFECGSGWEPVLRWLLTGLDVIRRAEAPELRLAQVKEKWGMLRVYLNGAPAEAHTLCAVAEAMSSHVCETCGKAGSVRNGSWIVTQCDECHEKDS